jgi:hypothetical protein
LHLAHPNGTWPPAIPFLGFTVLDRVPQLGCMFVEQRVHRIPNKPLKSLNFSFSLRHGGVMSCPLPY